MRKRFLVYIVFPLLVIFILSGCRYYFGGNYPKLAIESLDTVKSKFDEKSDFEHSIKGTLLNHGAPGEFIIKVSIISNGKWKNTAVYGPIYIVDKANFNVTWYTILPYEEKIRAEFYAIRRDGDRKKEFTIEY